ncbi:DUF3626 domain-containing protein [Nonomuraea sp. NPDC059194]|uniref:DUF3626 domain-containing protein n=1 Tax=Nonomuraea sp. NPDC059194 TaxID=3346764 RepID=UPI0036B48B65
MDRVDGDTVYVSEVTRSGDGWVFCACEAGRHRGTNGAAGLLLLSKDADGEVYVLMRHVASDGGDTWSLPGGVRDLKEGGVAAALREAAEQSTLDPSAVQIHGRHVDDHGRWSYETVIATVGEPVEIRPVSRDAQNIQWVRLDDLANRNLHPGFAASWADVHAQSLRVVDWDAAASRNVSRTVYRHDELPDGDVDALVARFAAEGVSGRSTRQDSLPAGDGVPVETVIRTRSGDTLPPGAEIRVVAVERDAFRTPDGRQGIRLYLAETPAGARVPDLSRRVLSVGHERLAAELGASDAAVSTRVEGAVTVSVGTTFNEFRLEERSAKPMDLAAVLAMDPRLVADPDAAILLRGPHAVRHSLIIQQVADLTGRPVIAFDHRAPAGSTDGAAKIFLPESEPPAATAGEPSALARPDVRPPEGALQVRAVPDPRLVAEYVPLRELTIAVENMEFLGDTYSAAYASAVAERDVLKARLEERTPDLAEADYLYTHAGIAEQILALADDLGVEGGRLRAHLRDELVDLLDDRPVALRIDPEHLLAVLTEGRFKTQFEVAWSGGALDTLRRSALEEGWFGYPADLPPEQRPIYGYVNLFEQASDPTRIGIDTAGRVAQYGEAQITLRPEIRDRTTFCVGDSYEGSRAVVPSPINDPRPESYNVPGPGAFGQDDPLGGPLRDYTDERFLRAVYVEAQIHGGVRAGDIDHVVFTHEPGPDLVAALETAGIPWYYVYPRSQQ